MTYLPDQFSRNWVISKWKIILKCLFGFYLLNFSFVSILTLFRLRYRIKPAFINVRFVSVLFKLLACVVSIDPMLCRSDLYQHSAMYAVSWVCRWHIGGMHSRWIGISAFSSGVVMQLFVCNSILAAWELHVLKRCWAACCNLRIVKYTLNDT